MNAVVVNSRNAGSRSTAAPAPRSRRNRFRSRSRSRSRSPLSPRTGLDTSRHREPGSSGGDHDAAVFPRIPSHRIHNDHRVGRVGEDDVARVHFRDFCGRSRRNRFRSRSRSRSRSPLSPRTGLDTSRHREPGSSGGDHDAAVFPRIPSHRIHNDHRVGRVGEDDVARVHFRDFCGIPPSPLLVGRSSGGDATQSIPRTSRTSRTSRTRRMPRRIGYDNVRHGDELFPAVWNGECVLNPGQPPPGYRLGWVPI